MVAAILWCIFNTQTAFAALVGGLTSCFSNVIFAGWFFSIQGFAQNSRKIVSAFYTAEALKIFFTALAFALAVVYSHLPLLPLFIVYFIIHISFSFIALVWQTP
jgi:F0F1-type ATP synthase assembly protein I